MLLADIVRKLRGTKFLDQQNAHVKLQVAIALRVMSDRFKNLDDRETDAVYEGLADPQGALPTLIGLLTGEYGTGGENGRE